jgi:cellulase/cellobiase CelA1
MKTHEHKEITEGMLSTYAKLADELHRSLDESVVNATTAMRAILASMAELPVSEERLKKLKKEILDKIAPVHITSTFQTQ